MAEILLVRNKIEDDFLYLIQIGYRMDFISYLYCVSSSYTEQKGLLKLGLTIHPVHRMQVYNTGDALGIGLEKRYRGLWQVRAKNRAELHSLERHLHIAFQSVRQTRANGNYTEWFTVPFEKVKAFMDSQSYVLRELTIEEIDIIHKKSECTTSLEDLDNYREEELLVEQENNVILSLKDTFFATFLPGKIPRRIQTELWDRFEQICANSSSLPDLYKGIVQWPTGTGKTIAILLIIVLVKEHCKRNGQIYRGLFVTPRNDIFDTITSEFNKLSVFGITLVDGSNGRLSRRTIQSDTDILVMACPDSLRNEDTGMASLPDMVHVHYDEVHRITAELYFQQLKGMLVKWNTKFLTGTSATPKTSCSEQHRKLAELFGDPYLILHRCDVDEAVQEGWIATPRFIVSITPKQEKGAEAAYYKALAKSVQTTIQRKQSLGKWNKKGGKVIIYTPTISAAELSAKELQIIMPDAHTYLAIDGERTDRAFRTDKADGSVRVLFACGRYREGSDIPGLEMTGVLIGSSISAYILIQIQGRSLRMDHAEKEGWCLLVSPCEEGETEQDVLDRIALDILTFLGENHSLVKKDIERYVHTYFADVIINGSMCSKEETIDRIQSAYIRREYTKRTPKERYATIRSLNREMGLTSKTEYEERRMAHPNYIREPKNYFKDYWISWYHFLGIDTSPFPQTKMEWIHKCKELGITSWSTYKHTKNITLPDDPLEMYEDFTNWDKEIPIEEELVW